MTDRLYVKKDGQIVPVAIEGSGGATSRSVFYSTSRSSTLTAGTAFTVPQYVVGDYSLEVFLNGLRLTKGVEYTEASTTTIAFTSDIKPTDEITAVSYAGSTGARAVQTDESRSAVIAAGTSYTVPTYPLGAQKLSVYLGGLKFEDFEEATATSIRFLTAIPAKMPITVVVES